MKMRALTNTGAKKLKEIAAYLAKNGEKTSDVIPPAYSCDRERLVVICTDAKKSMSDSFRRFCMELSKDKAQNVAMIANGAEADAEVIAGWIKDAGANFVAPILYIKCGLFAGGMKLEDQQTVDAWYADVLTKLA